MDLRDTPDINWFSWGVVVAIAISFLAWGLFVYWSVGQKWPPEWDFGAVEDVPGVSVYASRKAQGVGDRVEKDLLPPVQHVMGEEMEEKAPPGRTERKPEEENDE